MMRAKFVVQSVKNTVDGAVLELIPVTRTTPENAGFFQWTPFGSIEIGTINREVANQFVPGQEYYVDFTPANKE